jgi:hypothetical protein
MVSGGTSQSAILAEKNDLPQTAASYNSIERDFKSNSGVEGDGMLIGPNEFVVSINLC